MTRRLFCFLIAAVCATTMLCVDGVEARSRKSRRSKRAAKTTKEGKSPSAAKNKKGKVSGEVALFNRDKKAAQAKPKTHAQKQVARRLAANRAALKGRASVEDIDDEIEILKELLDIERGSPSEADTLLELSYVLWDRALAYELEAYDTYYTVGIAEAESQKNQGLARRLKIEQQNLLEESRGTKSQVIDFLKRIERRFPNYNKLDEVLYALGFHLAEVSRHGESVDSYMRLVRKRPQSTYLPDAYFGIGNYYFGKNQGGQAMKWFAKVKKYPRSNAYGWALYYESWIHYNRMNYRVATQSFVKVIEYSLNEAKGRVNFLDDGTKYMVRSWSEYGDPKQALEFFEKTLPKAVNRLLAQLADYYVVTSRYGQANFVLDTLIKRRWEEPEVIEFLFRAVDNAYKQGELAGTISRIERLSQGLLKHGNQHKRSQEVAVLLAEIASNYHAESERTLDKQTLAYAEKVYLSYLSYFPKHKFAYDMRHNHALALFQLERWKKAAAEYEAVIDSGGPQGKYAEPSAHRALICYLKTQKLNEETAAKGDDEIYKARKMRPEKQRIANACERYVEIAQRQNKVEDVPEALFVLARLYYRHNQFERSGQMFANFVTNYISHKLAKDAARLMLSSFSLGQDGKNLIKWTNQLIADQRFNRGQLGQILTSIKENEDYNRCLELKDEARKAAACLLKYAKEYPKGNIAVRAMTGAADFYRRVRDMPAVVRIYRKIAKTYPRDPRAAEALYLIGEIYRETADFKRAASTYEKMADTFPKADLSKAALQRAAIIRDGLGQDRLVVANGFRSLKMKAKRLKKGEDPDPQDAIEAAEMAYRLTVIYLRQKKWRQAIMAAYGFVRSRDDLPQYLQLAALSNIANAWMNIRRGQKKALKYLTQVETIANQLAEERKLKKLHPLGRAAIAQAEFLRGEFHFKRMLSISGRSRNLKQASKVAAKKSKEALLADKHYETVERSKNERWIAAAASRRGRAQHEIGLSMENLPVPRAFKRRDELIDEWKTKTAEKAAPFYDRAKSLYRSALKRAAEKYAFDSYWKQALDSLKELDQSFAQKATMPEFTVGMSEVTWQGKKSAKAVIKELRRALFERTRQVTQVKVAGQEAAQSAAQVDVAAMYRRLAFAHYELGQYRMACMVASAGQYLFPQMNKNSQLLTMMGLARIKSGDIQKGMVRFSQAAKADTSTTDPLLNMASVQIKRLDLESANKLLNEVLARDPKHYWARVTSPVALRRLEDTKGPKGANVIQALKVLDQVVTEYPERLEGHYNRCVINQAHRSGSKAKVMVAKSACETALTLAKKDKSNSAKAKELAKRVQGLNDALEFME